MRPWIVWLLLCALALPLWAQPVSARNKYKVGRGHFQKEEYERAIRYFEEAVKEDGTYLDAHYLMGLSHLGMKNYAKAEEKLRYVIGLDPQFNDAYAYLGQSLTAQKKFEAARTVYQKMLAVPGGAVPAHYCLGVVAYQEGNLNQAERSWKEVSRLDPKDARSRNNLGVLAQAQGKHQEALLHFQMAAKLVPENPAYLLNESWELLALGRNDTARKQLLRIQRLSDQRHDVGFLALGLLARLDNKWEVVVTHCDSCLKRNPEYTQAWLLKGQALEQLKKPAEALEAYRKAVESDPNVKEAEAAVSRLEKAVSPSPTPKPKP